MEQWIWLAWSTPQTTPSCPQEYEGAKPSACTQTPHSSIWNSTGTARFGQTVVSGYSWFPVHKIHLHTHCRKKIQPFLVPRLESWNYLDKMVNTMVTDALLPCVTRSSAAMILIWTIWLCIHMVIGPLITYHLEYTNDHQSPCIGCKNPRSSDHNLVQTIFGRTEWWAPISQRHHLQLPPVCRL